MAEREAVLHKALGRILEICRIADGSPENKSNTKERTRLMAIRIVAQVALGVK
jgi:hypothetical protein